MYKMIVIDDEYLVRLGIKETIEWSRYDIEIIGEATNGKKGLELAEELKPDLIISDVRMPIMDGLELVQKINERNLDCTVIILSGYNDFQYAKGTLENGAYSYLLKPIDNEELIQTVLEALRRLLNKRENEKYLANLKEELPSIRQNFLSDLIYGELMDETKILEKINLYKIPLSQKGFLIYGQIDNPEEQLEQERVKTCIKGLYDQLRRTLSQKTLFGTVFNSHFVLITSGQLESIYQQSIDAVKQYESIYEQVISLGISEEYQSVVEIKSAYLSAKQKAKHKLYPMINTVTSSEESEKFSPQVIEAMDFIAKNFHKNLTVKMVADSLYVSESYLMHVFKDNVGKTFNECLTDYRMMMAKKMLTDGKYKIYEIADKVGYNDSKYFSQIFRKKEGISPSEFLDQKEVDEHETSK